MRFDEAVDQFLLDLEVRGRSVGTVQLYRRVLSLLARWLVGKGVEHLEAVTLFHLREFLQFLRSSSSEDRGIAGGGQRRLALSTFVLHVSLIKAFFRWCHEERLLDSDPSGRLRKPKLEKRVKLTLRPEQVEALLGACDVSTRDGLRDYAIVAVLLDTGIRVSELVGLELSDLDLRHRCLKVRGKGRKERVVGLYPAVVKVLFRYLQVARPRFASVSYSSRLFLGRRGPLTVRGVRFILDRLVRSAGLESQVERGECPRVHPHVFRHTFAKQYLLAGGDLFKLSTTLGHASVQVTSEVYLSDFRSADALVDHDQYSPARRVRFPSGRQVRRGRLES
ncbi:tyrosine-type recombinase/integrase [Thermogemmatispora sp.]|uniref:tyrosine-type recombinase/integrase n=1 Tax=Thermogemmatispora sp. TaxID=1968838 RepID=UPI0035E45301